MAGVAVVVVVVAVVVSFIPVAAITTIIYSLNQLITNKQALRCYNHSHVRLEVHWGSVHPPPRAQVSFAAHPEGVRRLYCWRKTESEAEEEGGNEMSFTKLGMGERQ